MKLESLKLNRQSSVVCYLTSVSFFGFLSSAVCPLSSVFMQNKPNSPIVQMNSTYLITMNYAIFTSLTKVKNKPNSNPNFILQFIPECFSLGLQQGNVCSLAFLSGANPIQTQTNPISIPNKANSNPIKPNFKLRPYLSSF